MLHINGGLVKMDRAVEGFTGEYTISQLYSYGVKAISNTGVLGDPRKASADAGRKMMEKLAEYYAEKIKKELKF
jgi:creatinine amidohydrolase